MKKLLAFSCIYFLLHNAAQAAECNSKNDCDIYSTPDGGVIANTENGSPTIFKDRNESNYSTYIDKKNNRYFLIRESNGNDKSFVIIPLEGKGETVSLQRIIFLSLNMVASGAADHDVWSGQEYDLANPMALRNFSWDIAFQYQTKLTSARQKTPGTDAPSGFFSLPVTVYGENHSVAGRVYIYPQKTGVSPDGLTCMVGCVSLEKQNDMNYVGAIGKYAVSVHMKQSDEVLAGSYRYIGKNGSIFISGSVVGDEIKLSEFSDSALKNETGRFEGIKVGSKISGKWNAIPGKRILPFYLIPETL